jgi:hypothetical protein
MLSHIYILKERGTKTWRAAKSGRENNCFKREGLGLSFLFSLLFEAYNFYGSDRA